MPNATSSNPEHDQVFSMLPWYVNKTLEPSQRGSVSRHVDHCRECQSEVQFLNSLNETVQSDASFHHGRHVNVEESLASVMNRIDAQGDQSKTSVPWPTLLKQKLEKVFSFSEVFPGAQWGATAVAGVLVAVLGFQWYAGQSEGDYSVLSSSEIDAASMRLSVEISATADPEQAQSVIQSKFERLGQPIALQTNSEGGYVIVLKDPISVSELNDMIISLEDEAQIERVELLP